MASDYADTSSTVSPFQQVVSHWRNHLTKAIDYKRTHFDKDANEARLFLTGGKNLQSHIYGGDAVRDMPEHGDWRVNDVKAPSFLMTTNRVAEMKDLFVPHLYHQNPHRQVNPRTRPVMPQQVFFPPMPPQIQQQLQAMDPQSQQQMMQQIQQTQQQGYQQYTDDVSSGDSTDAGRAVLLEAYLNYTPIPLHLRDENRMAVEEALITGLGIMVSEPYRVPGSDQLFFGSFFDSVDNSVFDPDGESIDLSKVWFRRRVRPLWEVEDERTIPYGFPRGYLKGNVSSMSNDSAFGLHGTGPFESRKGLTCDMLCYWEVWSKTGLGGKLSGVADELRKDLDQFGDYVYMEIADTCKVPLNFLGAKDGEDLQARMRWPTPFWRDGTWPCTPFQFHKQSRCCYPYSHVKPGLAELKFLNWCYSFLACKVKNTSRDFIITLKQAGDELKKAILQGGDLTHIPLSLSDGSLKINDVVQWLQHPGMNQDIFNVMERIENQFERRTGMTPLLYGEVTTQSRLAGEADFRRQTSMVRVDDMADAVEESCSQMARKEAFGARYHLDAQRDIRPVLGNSGAQFWERLVTPADPDEILHDLEYRIEAGSIRKPNRERDTANMNQAVQTWGPVFQGWASATGDVGPTNALIKQWGKVQDMDVSDMFLKPPPPPDPNQPSPEQQKAQTESQQMQMQMQADQQKAQLDLQAKQQDMAASQQQAQLSAAEGQQEMIQRGVQFQQELAHMQAKHALEIQALRAKASVSGKKPAKV